MMKSPQKLSEEFNARKSHTASSKLNNKALVHNKRPLRVLLILLIILTLSLVTIGGITRHTDSGLSITNWGFIKNIIPPMTENEWEKTFSLYRQTPEYNLQNSYMIISDFKQIFWWEWIHRFLGRLTGLIWFTGFMGLIVTRNLPSRWFMRLLIVGALGMSQALIGWWMVSSGLAGNKVDVAPYRLAIHLMVAFAIISYLWWLILTTFKQSEQLLHVLHNKYRSLEVTGLILLCLLFIQIGFGALVAGLDAGRAFPTWPLMNGNFFPKDSFILTPLIINIFENPSLVHFMHRMVGYGVGVFALVFWLIARTAINPALHVVMNLILAACGIQIVIGIFTTLTAAQQHLALLHQFIGVVLIVLAVSSVFFSRYPLELSFFRNKL